MPNSFHAAYALGRESCSPDLILWPHEAEQGIPKVRFVPVPHEWLYKT